MSKRKGEQINTNQKPSKKKKEISPDKWNREQVRDWANVVFEEEFEKDISNEFSDIIYKQYFTGKTFLTLNEEKLMKIGIPLGPATSLSIAIENLSPELQTVQPDLTPVTQEELDEQPLPPHFREDDPPFVSETDWLENTTKFIIEQYNADKDNRISPLLVARCSRGGKTRALKEISKKLRKDHPDILVIYITLNDNTCLKDWEQQDPIGALCRRIAFAFRKDSKENNPTSDQTLPEFLEYRQKSVSPELITNHLKGKGCILLVDELNQLNEIIKKDSLLAKDFASFVKENFLQTPKRYFIFSSHIVSTASQLTNFMDSQSSRGVKVWPLPLIPNVPIAAKNLHYNELNCRVALYYDLSPALIYTFKEKTNAINYKRDFAIQECKDDGLITNESIRLFLCTFLDGNYSNVPEPLLSFMDTIKDEKIHWIPCHIHAVLEAFASHSSLSNEYRTLLLTIVDLFTKFLNAKTRSGEGWEALFIIVLLIRCITGLSDENNLLNLSPQMISDNPHVSYNDHLNLEEMPFDQILSIDELVKKMEKPATLPHIVIYYPSNAQFKIYDVIVVAYDKYQSRKIFGYQLKENEKLSKSPVSHLCTKSYLISGQPKRKTSSNSWTVANKQQIEDFFGVSGKHWTPAEWKKLSNSQTNR